MRRAVRTATGDPIIWPRANEGAALGGSAGLFRSALGASLPVWLPGRGPTGPAGRRAQAGRHYLQRLPQAVADGRSRARRVWCHEAGGPEPDAKEAVALHERIQEERVDAGTQLRDPVATATDCLLGGEGPELARNRPQGHHGRGPHALARCPLERLATSHPGVPMLSSGRMVQNRGCGTCKATASNGCHRNCALPGSRPAPGKGMPSEILGRPPLAGQPVQGGRGGVSSSARPLKRSSEVRA